MIDTHCNIYLDEFQQDREEMILRAENEGVNILLMPAIDKSTYEQMMDLQANFPLKCRAMMGLHPCSVTADFEEELAFVKKCLQEKEFIAIGEIGLDFYWDKTFSVQQYDTFRRQIELALQYDLPIVIHSRNSIDECITVVGEHQNGKLKGVFHCFSGTTDQAKQIIDLDFYLGIGGVLTYKNSGLDKVMEDVDIKNIVLETDSPYLTPVPFRGKRNEPAYLKYIAQKLSEIKQIPITEVENITTQNTKNLFRL